MAEITLLLLFVIALATTGGGRGRERERDGRRRVDNRERELITVTSINMYNATPLSTMRATVTMKGSTFAMAGNERRWFPGDR